MPTDSVGLSIRQNPRLWSHAEGLSQTSKVLAQYLNKYGYFFF